jgi:6-phosphogluconolactonase (cycloisomerase 2 family)
MHSIKNNNAVGDPSTDNHTSNSTVDMLIGGFGQQGGGDCLGIDWVRASIFSAEQYEQSTTQSLGHHESVSPQTRGANRIALEHLGLVADLPSPTWLMIRDSVVYAPLEFSNEVLSLSLKEDANGVHLEPLSRVAVDGTTPTHLAISKDESGDEHLIVACYGDGHVCVHPVDSQGHIGASEQVLSNEGHGPLPAQECPHAHWILPLPDGRILTSDLGADQIHVHKWKGKRLERIASIACAPGTGPRDLHVLPGKAGGAEAWSVAVVDEWSTTVDIFAPDQSAHSALSLQNAGFRHIQRIELDADPGDQAASLAFVSDAALAEPSSQSAALTADATSTGYCYVGLRGSDRIVALKWDGERLSYPSWATQLQPETTDERTAFAFSSGGGRPRHIKAIGSTLLIANQITGKLSSFRLTTNGEAIPDTEIVVGSPTAIAPLN